MQMIIRPTNAQRFFFTVMFCNKGMEQINLNRFLGSEGAITRLSGNTAPKKYSGGYI